MSLWKLAVRALDAAPIPWSQNRWIHAGKNADQSLGSDNVGESILREETINQTTLLGLAKRSFGRVRFLYGTCPRGKP